MRIAGTLPCSFINGPGIRYVVFCQGCPHQCPGCHNPDTWDPDEGEEMKAVTIARDIARRHHINGVTLSGGEPFLQQEECVKLLKLIPKNLDIWIYTGYKYEEIKDTELAKMADFIVDGKFEIDNVVSGELFGSTNQRIINVKKGTAKIYGQDEDVEL